MQKYMHSSTQILIMVILKDWLLYPQIESACNGHNWRLPLS